MKLAQPFISGQTWSSRLHRDQQFAHKLVQRHAFGLRLGRNIKIFPILVLGFPFAVVVSSTEAV